jgi:hypothetical protein
LGTQLIWLKMRTREPFAFISLTDLSRIIIFG